MFGLDHGIRIKKYDHAILLSLQKPLLSANIAIMATALSFPNLFLSRSCRYTVQKLQRGILIWACLICMRYILYYSFIRCKISLPRIKCYITLHLGFKIFCLLESITICWQRKFYSWFITKYVQVFTCPTISVFSVFGLILFLLCLLCCETVFTFYLN
jgi:hypothetical protein